MAVPVVPIFPGHSQPMEGSTPGTQEDLPSKDIIFDIRIKSIDS
jgi:hypothetical protein